MPMPVPSSGEDESAFISRCMGDAMMRREHPKQDERLAVCYGQWGTKRGAFVMPKAKQTAFALIVEGAVFAVAGDRVEASGIPTQTFRKDVIRVGTFKHPEKGWTLDITVARIGKWLATFQDMLGHGVEVPLKRDHKPGSDNVLGYIRGLALDGEILFATVEARGEQAIELCQRVNRVSIEIHPDFVDGEGRHYGEAVVGLALTGEPVVPAQDGFVPIAASLGGNATEGPELVPDPKPTPEGGDDQMDFAQFTKLLGVEVTDEATLHAGIKAAFKAKDDGYAKALAAAKEKSSAAITAAREEGAIKMDPLAADAWVELTEASLANLVKSGNLLPAVAKKLAPVLVGTPGARPAFMLDRRAAGEGADKCIARQIVDVLSENDPIALGEATKAQVRTLDREAPDGPDATPEELDALEKGMAATASGETAAS